MTDLEPRAPHAGMPGGRHGGHHWMMIACCIPMLLIAVVLGIPLGLWAGLTPDGVAGAWGVRIYVKPFVDWIWGGCLLMALGGFLAIADRRYRNKVSERVGAAFAAARA